MSRWPRGLEELCDLGADHMGVTMTSDTNVYMQIKDNPNRSSVTRFKELLMINLVCAVDLSKKYKRNR